MLRVHPDDPDYLRDVRDEAAFWDRPQFFSAEACEDIPETAPFSEHSSLRLTGDRHTRWFETLQRYGPFRRGLSLGVQAPGQEARILDLNPALHLTFTDVSRGSLERRQDLLGARFPGRVATRVDDLNFVELPRNTYDVILSSGTLHHLLNIEHLASQVRLALTPGGYFFLQDYTAEERFEFRPEKVAILDALVQRGKARGDVPQSWRFRFGAGDRTLFSPFEAIRSTDTIDVLGRELDVVSVRGTGALTGLLIFAQMDDADAVRYESPGAHLWHSNPYGLTRRVHTALGRGRRPAMGPRFQRELFLLDSLMCDSGFLLAGNTFAVFRRPSD